MFNFPIRRKYHIPFVCKRFFRKKSVILHVEQATLRDLEEWRVYGKEAGFLVDKLIEWKCPKWAIPQILLRQDLLMDNLEKTYFFKEEFPMIPEPVKEEEGGHLIMPPSCGFIGMCKELMSPSELLDCTMDQINYFTQGMQYNATHFDKDLKFNALTMQGKKNMDRSPEMMKKLADLEQTLEHKQ